MQTQDTAGLSAATPVPRAHRKRLRYDTLVEKARPSDFLRMDEALDAVGATHFKTAWGQSAAFKRLPFRYLRQPHNDARGFYLAALEKRAGKASLMRKVLPVPRRLFSDYREEAKMLKRAVDLLRDALYKRTVKAVRHTCALPEIGRSERGIWSRHVGMIFYTGYIPDADGTGIAVVLIERTSFERWLEGVAAGTLNHRLIVRRELSTNTKQTIAKTVSAHVRDNGYRLFREDCIGLVCDVLKAEGFAGAGSRALEIWSSLAPEVKMKRGHPMGEQTRERMEADKDNLKSLIQEVLSCTASVSAQAVAAS